MHRRRYLVAVGITALTGCFGTDGTDPNEQTIAAFETGLEDSGVEIDAFEYDETESWLGVDYYSEANEGEDDVIEDEVQVITLAYAGAHHENSTFEVLDARATGDEGKTIYLFEIETEWVQEFQGGNLSEGELVDRAQDTVE